jgi:hypothetical protein
MARDASIEGGNARREPERAEPERRPFDAAQGRKCAPDMYCINLSRVKIELEGFKQKSCAEYAALERLVGELRELVVALPKEVAAQIAKDRREVNHSFEEGNEDFREIFRRLAKLEKAVLAIYIIVALVIVGRGLAWFLGVMHVL